MACTTAYRVRTLRKYLRNLSVLLWKALSMVSETWTKTVNLIGVNVALVYPSDLR